MDCINIRRARASDVSRLNKGLSELSAHLGDTHRASDSDILSAGFGRWPSFTSLLAERQGELLGVTIFSPVFSTSIGAPGVYVSDLWVTVQERGNGLGRRLLREAAMTSSELWGARYLKLSVYHGNDQAHAAYHRIGFEKLTGESTMMLNPQAFTKLRELS